MVHRGLGRRIPEGIALAAAPTAASRRSLAGSEALRSSQFQNALAMGRQLLASRTARLLRLLHDPAMPRRDTALPRPPHMAMYSPPML